MLSINSNPLQVLETGPFFQMCFSLQTKSFQEFTHGGSLVLSFVDYKEFFHK